MAKFAGVGASGAQTGQAAERSVAFTTNRLALFWDSAIGKKVVMAVTGIVLVGFVIAHMLGNLKIFLGPEAIDAYAVFLRTMGEPMLPYSLLLWVVRIVMLASGAMRITAAVPL